MNAYRAPVEDIRFALNAQAGYPDLARLWGCDAADGELVDAMLGEAARLADNVLAPANRNGDLQGASLDNGVVRLADGFRQAHDAHVAGGWNALSFPEEHGGLAMPWTFALAVSEMFESANMAFAVKSLLTRGAAELLLRHGSDTQKRIFLPPMIAGTWSGTMNLTEPQGRHRPRTPAHTGGARRRRHLPGDRSEDLHHLGRP